MSVWRKLGLLFTRKRYDEELRDEIAFHIDCRERELMAEGISPEEARHQARRAFGNDLRVQETSRRAVMFWWEWMVQDLRFAFRLIRKAPGFTAVVVISMAIAIGASTSIFSVLNAMVLRQLAVRAPGEMYLLSWSVPKSGFPEYILSSLDGRFVQDSDGRYRSDSISYPMYQALRERQSHFEDLFAFAANSQEVNIGFAERSFAGHYVGVSGNYFNVSGVVPFRGRILGESDDTAASAPVGMLSYRFWIEIGGDPNVIGKQAVVNGQPVTVVGIAPPGFVGFDPSAKTDIFVPLQFYIHDYDRILGPYTSDAGKQLASFSLDDRSWWVTVGGRIKPNVEPRTATAELNTIFSQQLDQWSKPRPQSADAPRLEAHAAQHGLDTVRREYETACLLLLGLVGVVLVIACANVSSLLLARASARQREIAQRLSVGASRRRILWQLLTESLLLSALGAIAGWLLAYWASSGLAALISNARNAGAFEIHLDVRVLLFTAAVTVVSGIFFGLAPAMHVSRTDPMAALKQVPGTTRTERGHWPGKLLVAGQLALALVLMVGAGLFVRTLREFGHMNLGFDQLNLVIFTVKPGLNGYEGSKLVHYYSELQRRVEGIPGVANAAIAQRGPIGQGGNITRVSLPGNRVPASGSYQSASMPELSSADKKPMVNAYLHLVGDGYFDTMHIPLLAGRPIGDGDIEKAHDVVVVNQAFLKRYLDGQNALGTQIGTGSSEYEIVGVAGDVKYEQMREAAPPTIYISYRQRKFLPDTMTYLVRVDGAVAPVMRAIEREALNVDPTVPVADVQTEQDAIHRALFIERSFTLLSTSFAGIALLLACVGLYGTLAYMVVRRTGEIGVRMALGAQRGNILEMILRDGWKMAIAGVLAGVPLAMAGVKVVESRIYGVPARDPLSLAIAVAAVLLMALCVGALPAVRASRLDPMVALKHE